MKKLIFVLIAALGMSCTSYAQMTEKELKKATKTAQKLVKEARDEMERDDIDDKSHAKKLIDEAVKNPLIKDWDQTWFEAAEIYRHFYYEETRKLYNNQRFDTVVFYSYLTDWYKYDLIADSLQQIPNAKGKTSDEARKKHAPDVHRTLGDLVSAGRFYFNNRADYRKAYEMFDLYFTMAEKPLISSLIAADTIYQSSRAYYAYYPALAAYKFEDWDKVIKYSKIALEDEENGSDAKQLLCDAYALKGDTATWLEELKDGLMKYPTSEYYYIKLLAYYDKQDDSEELERFVTDMIKVDPEKALNYYVLGLLAQNRKNYDKAIEQYKIAIEKDEKMSEAYINLGVCILLQAEEYMESKVNVRPRSAEYKQVMQKEKEYYEEALPYYLKLREIEPNDVKKWGIFLQNIYYKLNMDKELQEIDKLLEESGVL